jgi:hypothetical protein
VRAAPDGVGGLTAALQGDEDPHTAGVFRGGHRSMTTRARLIYLKRLERALWIAGAAVGAWTLFVLAQNSYYARMPVPEGPSIARRLPGEDAFEAGGTQFGASNADRGWRGLKHRR